MLEKRLTVEVKYDGEMKKFWMTILPRKKADKLIKELNELIRSDEYWK